jgi:CubicO group peptidase (beta-lactamase class C family)
MLKNTPSLLSKIIKKTFKVVGLLLVLIIITVNLFIVLSGRFYLYKGISNTYLSGRTGPTIYDLHTFAYSTIKKSSHPSEWEVSSHYNTQRIPQKYNRLLQRLGTKAFLVFKDDQIIYEKYWEGHKKETVSNSFSAAKTVVALLIGIALDEGKIKSLDEPVSAYIPEFTAGGKDKITIRHLLMMASGLDWQESGKNPFSENAESYYGTDLYGLVTHQHRIEAPGRRFEYQSGNSQLLGYILEKATKKDLSQYAQEKIWNKIGSEQPAFWSLDKEKGDEKAFCCMYATARDFGRLGKLISQGGQWNDEQVISKSYLTEMVQNPRLATEEGVPNSRYGLHIWTYTHRQEPVYYCRGILGQYIIAIPNKNLVIVRLGNHRDPSYSIPQNKMKDRQFIYQNREKIGHPTDFFELLSLGEWLEKEIQK